MSYIYTDFACGLDELNRQGGTDAQDIGFYALAYDYGGETVISYRGTNFGIIPSPLDVFHGWSLGFGKTNSEQGLMALEFYP